MDAKQAILAGALLNAELMEQRDTAREQAIALSQECEALRARLEQFETPGEAAARVS